MDSSQLIAMKQARLLQTQKQMKKDTMITGQAKPNTYTYRDSSSLTTVTQGLPHMVSESKTLEEKKKKFKEDLVKENENTILVLLLGDGRVSVLENSLREAHKKYEYSSKQLRTTSMILTESYTGGNLDNFDIVILYTKNNLMFEMDINLHFNNIFEEGILEFHKDLGKNLNSYISKGGNLIMGSFCWGEDDAIPNFDYNSNSPFKYGGLSRYLDSYEVKPLDHPILKKKDPFSILITEKPLNIDKIITTISLTNNSQCIAKISETIPYIAVKEKKNSRIVGINSYISFSYSGEESKPDLIDIVYRSILWCKRLLG
jgi:hypothetical protein